MVSQAIDITKYYMYWQDICTSKPDFNKSKKHNCFDGLKLRINRGLSLRFANIYLISSPSIKGSIISLLSAQAKVILC